MRAKALSRKEGYLAQSLLAAPVTLPPAIFSDAKVIRKFGDVRVI
jgi:hypothetical protein